MFDLGMHLNVHAVLQQSHSCSSAQIKGGLLVSFPWDPLLGLLHTHSQRLPRLQWIVRIAGDAWTCELGKMSRRV